MQNRREVAIFLLLTFLLSSFFYAYLIASRDPQWNSTLAWGFMWCPGVAAALAGLLARRSIRDLGLRWGRTGRFLAGVVLIPILCGLAVYSLVWVTGLGQFTLDRLEARVAATAGAKYSGSALLVLALVAVAPVRIAVGALSTLGEELGWRGLLAPRLAETLSPAKASLITGAVWAAWHYPLMFVLLPRHRPAPPLWYATICFTLSVVGISFIYTWVRLRSGSVWPAVFLHSSSTTMQEMLEGLTRDTARTPYLTYEYGVGFTVVILLILAASWRRLTRDPAAP